MSETEIENTIDDIAARWAVRLARGTPLTAAERAELAAWLAADVRHQGALLRAEAAWQMLDRASLLKDVATAEGSHILPRKRGRGTAEGGGEGRVWSWSRRPPPPSLRDGPPPPLAGEDEWRGAYSRRGMLGLAISALAAAAVIVAAPLIPVGLLDGGNVYETALGEMRRVPLADGSLAAINTETRIEVALEAKLRRVELDRGEAWFQVAKDTTRPFVVAAGRVRVRAVGTAFSVRRLADGADIVVTEGEVLAWADGAEGAAQHLAAGSRAFIGDNARAARATQTAAEIKRSLAWREGQIALDGDTLAEAVAEFNRYNAVKIVIADKSLAGEKLVGWFRANEPDVFARAAAVTLGARMTRDGREIRLSRK